MTPHILAQTIASNPAEALWYIAERLLDLDAEIKALDEQRKHLDEAQNILDNPDDKTIGEVTHDAYQAQALCYEVQSALCAMMERIRQQQETIILLRQAIDEVKYDTA